MTKTGFSLLAVTLVCALHADPAQAQPLQVFVAANGNDANPCTVAAPCLTFQHAHDTVAAGGEISALDPADYGRLRIGKAISIQGHGFAGTTGIDIYAAATDAVNLKGLNIEGNNVSAYGIRFISGKSLIVKNCFVRNVWSIGLAFEGYAPQPGTQSLSVSDSYFTENGAWGILIAEYGSGSIKAVIERVAFYGNGAAGLLVYGGSGTGPISVAVTDSIAANNGSGFDVTSNPGSSISSLALTRSLAANNNMGLLASNATMRIGQSTVTGNSVGYEVVSGGAILSYGDNYMDGNGSNFGTLGNISRR